MDVNNDGYRDILSGSYSRTERPMAGLFQVLWGQAGGKFKQAAVLNGTDQKPLIIPANDNEGITEKICTRPTAVDWNRDGKLDLLVGNFHGSFYLFIGEGSGKFAPKPEPLMTGAARLRIDGAHGDPFAVDWDGDGDLDLLSGSSKGGVQWAENTAGSGKAPALLEFKPLIKAAAPIEFGQPVSERDFTSPAGSTRIWVDDVTGDGKLDILVGDSVTLVSAVKGVSKEEYRQKVDKWKKDFDAANQAQSEAGNDKQRQEAVQERFKELMQQRSDFMHEERTGYVWLYRRK